MERRKIWRMNLNMKACGRCGIGLTGPGPRWWICGVLEELGSYRAYARPRVEGKRCDRECSSDWHPGWIEGDYESV